MLQNIITIYNISSCAAAFAALTSRLQRSLQCERNGIMAASREKIATSAGELSASIAHGGAEILRYEIIYPRFGAATSAAAKINRYHQTQAKNFERLIKSRYLPAAREQHRALGGYGGFAPFEITATFHVMYSSARYVSLFTDSFMQLGHMGSRMGRSAHTYQLPAWQPALLGHVFNRGSLYRQAIISALAKQIEAEAEKNPGMYFSDWEKYYAQEVRENAFYLADDGIAVFFQQNTIGAKPAGIPTFLVPYSQIAQHLKHDDM